MSASAPAREAVTPDEIAKSHPPANAVERMLLTQVASSWERLQRAHELERQYFKGRDIAEIIRTKLEEFKAVTRYLTDCERAWRHALLLFEKAQRRRGREMKAAAVEPCRSAQREPAPSLNLPARPLVDTAHPMRE